MTDVKTLHQVLIEELGKRLIDKTELPDVISRNLNPLFPVRPYQHQAFQFFVNYWRERFDGKPRQNHQLLFHMATGSGKTLMMAGLMLYLYDQGYRNFLFFVNSTNIINKTRDNFLNPRSCKYLFADSISSGDRRITPREVDTFQAANQDDLNIVFTTIQGLHQNLNTPRENSLTYDDFEDRNLVLISDEAHHINADTKKGTTRAAQEELFEIVSWEGTVERIFQANPGNVLLEFTATMDLANDNLAAKYRPILIFDYPLKKFRQDGYSKEVKVLQADLPPFERALQAVLLSQYRRKLFERHQKRIKPVILFKSKTIKESQAFFAEFRDGIQSLRAEALEIVRTTCSDDALKKMFAYFVAHQITFENLITELREDFSEHKLIAVNSKEESEAKQLAVNSLEAEANEYRAVFAVDKLNEGWDVLNLFDIVRLYDTRDSKSGKIGKTTMSEAQLIGRGARYCPFQLSEEQSRYARKFDEDVGHELRVCEELYYHSAYNPKYIQELNSALREIGIAAPKTLERSLTLKENFKNTPLYRDGRIFLNERRSYLREEIEGLDSGLINHCYRIRLSTGHTLSTLAFATDETEAASGERKAKEYALRDFGHPAIRKALQHLDFYEFCSLRRYLPRLRSIHEFMTSERYLGNIRLEVSGLPDQVAALTPEQKLEATTRILVAIAAALEADTVEFKGTRRFLPRMIKDTFTDKTLNFAYEVDGDREYGRSMNRAVETSYHLDLSSRDWYVFNDCYGTSEEKLLIRFIDRRYDDLKNIYSDIYLLRNEKHFKLYAFDNGRPLEPDFVLYLIGREQRDTKHYQVFIEPKGAHLLRADEWKEQFLTSIKEKSEMEQLFANRRYTVWGLPFYNQDQRGKEFSEAFDSLLEHQVLDGR